MKGMSKFNKRMKVLFALFLVLALVIPTTAYAQDTTKKSIEIMQDELYMQLYSWGGLGYEFLPAGTEREEVTWKTGDSSIVACDEWGNLHAVATGTTTVTVTSESGLTDTIPVTVMKPLEWNGEKTETIMFNTRYVTRTFKLTVDETGVYDIYSESDSENCDPWVDLFDENGVNIGYSDDDGNEYDFKLTKELEAGKTYYVSLGTNGDEPCSISMTVCKSTGSSIQEPVGGFKEDSITLSCMDVICVSKLYGTSEGVEFSTSNEDVVVVQDNEITGENNGDVLAAAFGEGKATITVTSEGGTEVLDTLEITVAKTPALAMDELKDVTLGDGYVAKTYAITVTEAGTYTMKSKGNTDTYAELYDSELGYIVHNDDGDDTNFKIVVTTDEATDSADAKVTVGETYYLMVSTYYALGDGNYNFDECTTQVGFGKPVAPTSVSLSIFAYGDFVYQDNVYYVSEGTQFQPNVTFGDSDFASDEPYGEMVSSNENVVAFNGEIGWYAAGVGTANLTVTTESGLTDTITVKVIDKMVVGDMNLDGVWNSSDVQIISDIINGKVEMKDWYYQADVDGNNKIDADDIAAMVSSVEIVQLPTKLVYAYGEALDTTGLQVRVTFADGTIETVTTGYTVGGHDATKAGEQTLTIEYYGKTASSEKIDAYKITVNEKVAENTQNTGSGQITAAPPTGDVSATWMWMIMLVACAVVVALTIKKRRTV